jgi:hypothetical protein
MESARRWPPGKIQDRWSVDGWVSWGPPEHREHRYAVNWRNQDSNKLFSVAEKQSGDLGRIAVLLVFSPYGVISPSI